MTWDDESMRVIWISIHSWFYASILILNILNGSLQPKLKEGNVWPFNALHAVKWLQAESVIYGHCTGTVKRNWSNSTAVISKAILRGRLLGLTGVNCAQVSVRGLWTFRPFDVSPLHRTFCPFTGRFVTWPFRPRLWSFRPRQWTVHVRPRL